MYEVNRSVVIVRPRQPFLDWLRALPGGIDPGVTLASLQQNGNALLVPAADDADAVETFLLAHAAQLFQAELADWCEDAALWPAPLNAERFLQWFDLAIHPIVTDIAEEPLEREAFVPFDMDAE